MTAPGCEDLGAVGRCQLLAGIEWGRLVRAISGRSPPAALDHMSALSFAAAVIGASYHRQWPSASYVSRPTDDHRLTVRGSAPTQHAIGN